MQNKLASLRLKILFVSAMIIIITLLLQGTLAFYSTTGVATNVVTSGRIKFIILEKTADSLDFPEHGVTVIPGDTVSKKVSVMSACEHPFYLRIKPVYGIGGSNETLSSDVFKLDVDTQNWIEKDGWLYYKDIVEPNATTSEVFTEVHIVGEKVDNTYIGKALTITISAQAVQSENNPAATPWEALGWPEG